jgi:mono/diheme cytochrome c family protein
MREQQKLAEPYAASQTFGVAAREILTQTVAIGQWQESGLLSTGAVDGEPVDAFPFDVTREVLARGQQQFDTFCSPCHGFVGNGDGVVVQRGFPAPPSLHADEIRASPVGHYFDVITNGQGYMLSYASRIDLEDRWAIAAYIRALQLSQSVAVDTLPPDVQEQVQ